MKKQMPFTKEAYFRILDNKLMPPAPAMGSVMDKVLQVAQTVNYTATNNQSRN